MLRTLRFLGAWSSSLLALSRLGAWSTLLLLNLPLRGLLPIFSGAASLPRRSKWGLLSIFSGKASLPRRSITYGGDRICRRIRGRAF